MLKKFNTIQVHVLVLSNRSFSRFNLHVAAIQKKYVVLSLLISTSRKTRKILCSFVQRNNLCERRMWKEVEKSLLNIQKKIKTVQSKIYSFSDKGRVSLPAKQLQRYDFINSWTNLALLFEIQSKHEQKRVKTA